MEQFCCTKFQKITKEPKSVYNRDTTFRKDDGVWWTDFCDGEYGDIQLDFCPFCGTKLTNKE